MIRPNGNRKRQRRRIECLASADSYQRAIAQLADWIEDRQPLSEARLRDSVRDLPSIRIGDLSGSRYRTPDTFVASGSIRALEEPANDFVPLDTIVRAILGETSESEKKARGRELVVLLLELQKRALWQFHFPQETGAPDLSELRRGSAD